MHNIFKLSSFLDIYKGKVIEIVKQPNNFYDILIDIGDKIWARLLHCQNILIHPAPYIKPYQQAAVFHLQNE